MVDPLDAFYQQLDSEALLKQFRDELVADAREVLRQAPQAKVGAVIATPDSREAEPIREMLAKGTGQAVPSGLMVGICQRPMIEQALRERVDTGLWLEEAWQTQAVLPVMVATRDGHRFGFFGLGQSEDVGG